MIKFYCDVCENHIPDEEVKSLEARVTNEKGEDHWVRTGDLCTPCADNLQQLVEERLDVRTKNQ